MSGHSTADLSNIVNRLRQQEETAARWDNHRTTAFAVESQAIQCQQGHQVQTFTLKTR